LQFGRQTVSLSRCGFFMKVSYFVVSSSASTSFSFAEMVFLQSV